MFSRDDRSTVNRNHRVPSVFARSATTVSPFSCITKTAVGYYFAWPCKNIQSSALDRARNRRLAIEHLTAARNAAGKRLSGCFSILSTPREENVAREKRRCSSCSLIKPLLRAKLANNELNSKPQRGDYVSQR